MASKSKIITRDRQIAKHYQVRHSTYSAEIDWGSAFEVASWNSPDRESQTEKNVPSDETSK